MKVKPQTGLRQMRQGESVLRVNLTGLLLAFSFWFLAANPGRSAAVPLHVASFSTVGSEIVRETGGDRVQVTTLVRPGVDPHTYEPTPEDLKVVAGSVLILASGRHLEHYVPKLRQSAGTGSCLLELGNLLPSMKMKQEESAAGGKESWTEDPHWWHSIENMKRATQEVCRTLSALDPEGKAVYAHNADDYKARLDTLQNWARREIARLPRDQRKLVTSHDAFQYFAAEYGFTIYPIQGISTEDEPSSQKVARLIETIKKERVKAVFFESMENPKVMQEITKESGAVVGGELYADGLGTGEAVTYEGMFKHNVLTIVKALK